MDQFICVIPGDGCGREVTGESVKILEFLSKELPIDYEIHQAGSEYYEETGKTWSQETFARAEESDAILFGAVGKEGVVKPDGTRPGSEVIFSLRSKLDLYANLRPLKLYPRVKQSVSGGWQQVWKTEDVNISIVRELTEGLYVRIGGELENGEVAIDNRMITRNGSKRIIEFASELALTRRKHLTCVDKSNVLVADRLFRKVFKDVTRKQKYQALAADFSYVDAFSMFLVSSPEKWDVVVAPNLYGDIISDLGSFLIGGLGMTPSGSYGKRNAMFEPVHGSAPDIAGQGKANPSASFLSLSMLLNYLGKKSSENVFKECGKILEESLVETIQSGVKTVDLGGNASTRDFGRKVRRRFQEKIKGHLRRI